MAYEVIAIEAIDRDADTQARADVNDDAIKDYQAAIELGIDLPPLIVYGPNRDGMYYLADGWHRIAAYIRHGQENVACEVRPGTERDARLFACGANHAHGVRRTSADKRRAINLLLDDGDWGKKSSRMIAEHCHVGHQLVEKVRQERIDADQLDDHPVEDREGADGKKRAKPKPRAKQEATEKPAPEPKPKKNGQAKDPVVYRKAAKASFGTWVRDFDQAKLDGDVPEEVAEAVEYWNGEMAAALSEWWGK